MRKISYDAVIRNHSLEEYNIMQVEGKGFPEEEKEQPEKEE